MIGESAVLTHDCGPYLRDASTVEPGADDVAVVLPESAEDVRRVVAWAYEHDVAITPRGGGTGLAGGAVPLHGGIVLSLARLTAVRDLEPGSWRLGAEAGLSTAHVQRLAAENGLFFPANPGAAEQSQLGGNVATNAGGPRAFRYGSIGTSVIGVEAVVPPGDLVKLGGAVSKDVAGYDLLRLLVGSEGTLGVVTAAWLRLVPAPEARGVVAAFYASPADIGHAVTNVLVCGVVPSALEYLDAGALSTTSTTFPGDVPPGAAGAVLVEVDGSADAVADATAVVAQALAEGAVGAPLEAGGPQVEALLTWRESVSSAVAARRGAKLSEDISIPVDRLGEAIERAVEIGERHDLEACSWGHAGDGNLHASFLVSPERPDELRRAHEAAVELFDLAIEMEGSISGEHGLGVLKNGHLRRQWAPRAVALHCQVKSVFDPKGLLNPGKKLA